jgi:hypothetical protein
MIPPANGKQPSTIRRMVIAAVCHQARKQGVLGRLVIKVEGLRIELSSKCFDLLLVNNVGAAGPPRPQG